LFDFFLLIFVVSTSASDSLERLVLTMIYHMLSWTWNSTHSSTNSCSLLLLPAEATAVLFSASSKNCQHDNSRTAARSWI